MKKLFLFIFSLLIGIGLFFWIGRTVGWSQINKAFLVFTGWQGLVIFLLTLFIVLLSTWKWQEILKSNNVYIPFKKIFKYYLGGYALMYFFPMLVWGGEIFRGHVLKKYESLPWSKGMASIIIDRILEWTVNLVVIFFGVLLFLPQTTVLPSKLVIIFGGSFIFFFATIAFFYFKSYKKESIVRSFIGGNDNEPLDTEKEIFKFFKPREKTIWKIFGISFLRALIMYVRVWFLLFFLKENVSLLAAFSILGFSYLAAMIPIPTSLGSHEAIQTFAFGSIGLGLGDATVFAMIIRGVEVLFSLVGIIYIFRHGVGLINSLFSNGKPIKNN